MSHPPAAWSIIEVVSDLARHASWVILLALGAASGCPSRNAADGETSGTTEESGDGDGDGETGDGDGEPNQDRMWRGETLIHDSPVEFARVVMPSDCRPLVVWSAEDHDHFGPDSPITKVSARRWDGMGGWSERFDVDEEYAPQIDNDDCELAIDGSDNATVVWDRYGGPDDWTIRLRRYDAVLDEWSNTITLEPMLTGERSPEIASNADGDLVVAWQSMTAEGEWSVATTTYEADTDSWRPAITLQQMDGTPFQLRATIDEDGRAAVGWRSIHVGVDELFSVSHFDPQLDAWSQLFDLSGLVPEVRSIKVVSLPDGDLLATWIAFPEQVLLASRYDAMLDGWSPPMSISGDASLAWMAFVAANETGNVLATWTDTPTDKPMARWYDAQLDAWGEIVELATDPDDGGMSDVAVNALGDAIVTHHRYVGDSDVRLVARFYRADVHDWEPPTVVSENSASSPVVALSDAGCAVVIWSSGSLRANLYD